MVLTLAAVLLLAPAEGLRLEWQAPAACPNGEVLRARVVDLVGEQAAGQARLTARAVVRARGGRWTMALGLVREGGQDRRTLADADCRALAEAAALVIAVAIDPQAGMLKNKPVPGDNPADPVNDLVNEEPGPEDSSLVPLPPGDPPAVADPPGTPGVTVPSDMSGTRPPSAAPSDPPPAIAGPPVNATTVPGPDEPPPAVPADSTPASGARKLQLGLRLGAGLGFTRLLPGPHAALDLGLGLEGRLWRVELAGLFVPPVRGVAASDPRIGGVFRLGAGELRGCAMPGPRGRSLVFPLCVGLQFGAMHGRGEGSGLPVSQPARSPWVATRIGAALRWRPRSGRFGLWLGIDAIVALTRPSFVTARGVPVHEAARLGGMASVGLEVRLR